MFKLRYDKETEIPADQKAFYEQRDGAWFLKVEGAIPKEKLDEFRENNRTMKAELDAIKATIAGLDVEKAKILLQKQQELDDKELIKKGDVEGLVAGRVKDLKTDYERKLTEITAKLDRATGTLTILTIDNAVTMEATKKGVQPTAIPDITRRARETFKLEDGKPIAYQGDQKVYGRNGTDPLSISEWVERQTAEAPHLFMQNSGGGAGGSGGGNHGGGAGGKKNPFKKESFNLTEQMNVTKANPQLAAQLKAEAGVK